MAALLSSLDVTRYGRQRSFEGNFLSVKIFDFFVSPELTKLNSDIIFLRIGSGRTSAA